MKLNSDVLQVEESSLKRNQRVKWTIIGAILALALVGVMVAPNKLTGRNLKELVVNGISDNTCAAKCKGLPPNEVKICMKDCKTIPVGFRNCAHCKVDCIEHGGTDGACAAACKQACPNSLSSDIVGGSAATKHEYPSMVSLQRKDLNNRHWCGGTLLSSLSVLTAAHCCWGRTASQYRAVLGEHHLGVQDPANEQIRDVAELIIHPWYNPNQNPRYKADVCVVTLSSAITFTGQVFYVNLAPQGQVAPAAGTVTTTVGWGATSFRGSSSQTLLEVDVNVVTDSVCQSKYGSSSFSSDMICASSPGKDACQGDSGGPLFRKSDKVQVGIVSWGRGCAHSNYPGVYAEVSHFTNWIVSKRKGSTCVSKESRVRVLKDDVKEIEMKDVSVGDYVETVNGFEMVWLIEKRWAGAATTVTKLEIEHMCDGSNSTKISTISLTGDHMLFTVDGHLQMARKFVVGDAIDIRGDRAQCVGRVRKVSSDYVGVMSLVTYSGEFLLANGIRVSSYSHSEWFATVIQVLSFPVRLLSVWVDPQIAPKVYRALDWVRLIGPQSSVFSLVFS